MFVAPIISVEHLSKEYRLGMIGGGRLHQDLAQWWAKVRGRPDPLLKIGQEHHARRIGERFWALDDVSFEVEDGEVLGIIGRNGAGKSTLLKIMSQVTAPTSGQIKLRGRVASLLEVGTGFHHALTGRENIFLNGAILGMTKSEIRAKFDRIVEFAGVELYIDTPVKRYSSGMYVRLAFAVAAFLEPEILLVDEVLAVGDLEFQKKCLGRMKDVSTNDGRTVLFVSHDMSAISTLTSRCVLLSDGRVESIGATEAVIATYISKKKQEEFVAEPKKEHATITRVRVVTSEPGMVQCHGKPMQVVFEVHVPAERDGIAISFQIMNHLGVPITYNWIFDAEHPICRSAGTHHLRFEFENLRLYRGHYFIRVHLSETTGYRRKLSEFDCCDFEVDMLNIAAPEWGWQPNVCQYFDSGTWYYGDRRLKAQDHERK